MWRDECGKYQGLKLLEHTMKDLERIIDIIIRQQVDIDSMQFGFLVEVPLMLSLFSDKCRRNITWSARLCMLLL